MKKQLLKFLHTYFSDEEIRFLTKGWLAVRALGTLVFVVCFVSCRREIEYKGGTDEQLLVVSADMEMGKNPACFVCSTTPTLGEIKLDTVWYENVYSNGDTVKYRHLEPPRLYLSDASVRMRFNNGEWHTATYDAEQKNYVVKDYTLAVGDYIELEVKHAELGTATAIQTVPAPVSVSAVHTTDLYPEITENGWAQFALDIDAYTYSPDALIGIRLNEGAFTAIVSREVRKEEKVYDEKYGYTYTRITYDTITVLDTIPFTHLYAEGDIWNIALNNRRGGCKYYGAKASRYLYIPASQLQQSRRIALFADQNRNSHIVRQDSLRLLNLSIDVDVFSYDYYVYRTSVKLSQDEYDSSDDKFPTGEMYDEKYDYDGDYIEEIIADIGSLGNQESIQIYSNINGGIGHLATYAPTRLIIR